MLKWLTRTISATIAASLALLIVAWPLRADMVDGVAQVTRSLIPPVVYTSGSPSTSYIDCFRNIHLGGNAQFNLTITNVSLPWCRLRIINIDSYSGSGSGRGKRMVGASGITAFWLYPNQEWDITWEPNSGVWRSEQALNAGFGILWYPPVAPQFFVDTGGSNTANDGLASGASGGLNTIAYCVSLVYTQVVDRTSGTTICSPTSGQSFTELVSFFFLKPTSGILQISGATPGSAFTWNCPASTICIQTGDYGNILLKDVSLVGSASSTGIIFGHQYGVVETATNVSVTGASGSTPAFNCDYDTHFNIDNGLSYSGTLQILFEACPGSTWNINGTLTALGTPTVGRPFVNFSNSQFSFQGNVVFSGAVSTSVGLINGGAVMNNLSGSNPPGGAPTPAGSASTGWSAYCTSSC